MKASIAQHKQTHAPIQSDCASCHDPHASANKFQLKKAGNTLCFGCHTDTQQKITVAAVKHDAVSTGRECLACHDPHVSDIAPQLRGTTMAVCLSCHDKELAGPSGPIQNIKAWLASNPDAHGPIRQQDCAGCHRPHESSHFKLLKQDYPAKFYSPFDAKSYELCFNCHQPDLVRVERTTTLTGFRDGDRNLHFVHVNQPDKGRTCRACHEVHSSTKPKHIREKVPFGAWQLPIKYESIEGGGKCTPGCHVAYEYRRTVKLPSITAPAAKDE
jgi:predicted CXXCH cytochrome family protein